MDHGQLSMVADKFQWVFSESLQHAQGGQKDAQAFDAAMAKVARTT